MLTSAFERQAILELVETYEEQIIEQADPPTQIGFGLIATVIFEKSMDLIPSNTELSMLTTLLIIPVALFIISIGSLAIGLFNTIITVVSRIIEPKQITTLLVFWLSSVASLVLWFILGAYLIPTLIVGMILTARYLLLIYKNQQKEDSSPRTEGDQEY